MGCHLGAEAPKSNIGTEPASYNPTPEHRIPDVIIPAFRLNNNEWEDTKQTQYLHTHNIRSLCATDDGVWIASEGSADLVQMHNDGERGQTLEMISGIEDMNMSPLSGRLWMCCDDSTIRELEIPESANMPAEPAKVRFETGCMCIGVTYNEYIAVGTYMDVSLYSQDGELVVSTQNIPGSNVVKPYKIAACKKTRRIAVADWDDSVCGGEDYPNIAFFNDRLELQHRYHGETKLLKKRSTVATKFFPYDLCYDPQGLLLVADYKVRCINVIDTTGRFSRLLMALPSSDVFPLCLSLHNNRLWIGCSDKSLKVYKYDELTEN